MSVPFSPSSEPGGPADVLTVLGPRDPRDLGITLVHEHLYTDFAGLGSLPDRYPDSLSPSNAAEARWNPLAFPENGRFTDVDLTLRELEPLAAAGARTVVDVTPVTLGREPATLAMMAARSGLNVVMGAGWFLESFHPEHIRELDDARIADMFIREVEEGVGDTGIRVGILGELGAGDPLTDQEAKHLRAAAWAARETGVPISVHVQPRGHSGPAALAVLLEAGVEPDRVILGHMTTAIHDEAYQRGLLDRGACLAYDFIGMDHAIYRAGEYVPSDHEVALRIADLIAKGYVGQLLLSQDVSELIRLRAYGGWGYAHLLEHFVPLLRSLDVSDGSISRMLVGNPTRILSRVPRPGSPHAPMAAQTL